MKSRWRTTAAGMALALILAGTQAALAFDAKYKYTIPKMKTKEDAAKVVEFIKKLPGIMEVDTFLDNHTVVVFFDDEELEDEKMQLRIPLKNQLGYAVTQTDILYEDPEKRN